MINDKEKIKSESKLIDMTENWSEIPFEDRLQIILNKISKELNLDK